MATIRKEIDLLNKSYNASTNSFTPGNLSNGGGRMNKADYDPITEVYFETGFEYIDIGGSAEVELYDHTNSTSIVTVSSATGGWKRVRSADILGDLAAGDVDYRVRYRITNADFGSNVSVHAARIIIIQTGTIKKTVTDILVGDVYSTDTRGRYTEVQTPQRHLFTNADYDGTVSYEYHAVLAGNLGFPSGPASYAELYDIDGTTQLAEVSVSAVTPEMVVDTTVTTPTTGNILTSRIKNATGLGAQARMYMAHLVIKQTSATNIEKTVSAHHIAFAGFVENDSSYDLANRLKGSYDPAEYDDVTLTADHEATIKVSAGTGYMNISNKNGAAAALASSEINTTATSYEHNLATAITVPTASVDLFQDAYNTGGSITTASQRMLVMLTSIQVASTGGIPLRMMMGVGK